MSNSRFLVGPLVLLLGVTFTGCEPPTSVPPEKTVGTVPEQSPNADDNSRGSTELVPSSPGRPITVTAEVPALPPALPAVPPTSPETLKRLGELKGKYKLDTRGRVWSLEIKGTALHDGDLDVLRSLPLLKTLCLRDVVYPGGSLSLNGLQPLDSLKELRRLDVSNNPWQGSLDRLAGLSRLEFLDLRGTKFGDDAMLDVARLPRLKDLRLGHMPLSEQGLKNLSGSSIERFEYWIRGDQSAGMLGGLKRLRSWYIGFTDLRVSELPMFANADQLTEIRLICDDNPPSPEAVAALQSLKSLSKLDLSGRRDADWSILSHLDRLPRLEAVRLIGATDQSLRLLPRVPTVTDLELFLSRAGSEEGLKMLTSFPALRRLSLAPATTTAAGLAQVARCEQLEALVFYPNVVGNFMAQVYPNEASPRPVFVAKDLRPILELPTLKWLDITSLGFGDEVTLELVAATQLELLGITNLKVTDAGMERLRELKQLRDLDIVGTQVTYEAAAAFFELNPHCKISDNWCCGCLGFKPHVP
ncbi:MAG: hypothetical protein NT069_05555 [Planctomycetota bacterium]|nr:hypothetical protein [Planctomycetota bacterium]